MNRKYNPLFIDNVEDHLSDCYDNEEHPLERYRKDTETVLNHKDKVNTILNFIKSNTISSDDMKIFNKILGDRIILDKLIFVIDGSYRMNRIFYKNYRGYMVRSRSAFSVTYNEYLGVHINRHSGLSCIEKLNLIKNNYESIFIHLVSDADAQLNDSRSSFCYDQPMRTPGIVANPIRYFNIRYDSIITLPIK